MPQSIYNLEESIETANIEQWQNLSRLDKSSIPYINEKTKMKDPIKELSLNQSDILSILGYLATDDKLFLIYFWSSDISSIRWSKKEHGKLLGKQSIDLINLSCQICNHYQELSGIEFVKKINSINRFVTNESRNIGLDNTSLYWNHRNNISFVAVYKTISEYATKSSSGIIGNLLSAHEDYFHYKLPNWRSSPLSFLMEKAKNNAQAVQSVHLHPKCFDPLHLSGPKECFLWPWQRSLEFNIKTKKFVRQPISTTSLVLDLRKSTVAMDQFGRDRKGNFSNFINEIIQMARDAIFLHGGFFDKETGDGIVAHFISFQEFDSNEIETPEYRGFQASKEIVLGTDRIYQKYTKDLDFAIDKFGAAIGIHTGEAVWLAEENKIRAIGDSVILASRLCSGADEKEIFLSNKTYHIIESSLSIDQKVKFKKKMFLGKEYREDASLFGYCINTYDC